MNDPYALPPSKFSGKNLRDFAAFYEVQSYHVAEWVLGDNGEGKPEAVMLQFNLGKALDGVSFGIRLKSRSETNRLIQALERHRDGVWPK